ncbi:MAG: glycosyltransferase family 2 protein [Proteobacteria bacterium]|nr:glycosyltransferase family 2 protein [Pseudomonadota bacterium]MBU1059155.1 glycosyltransferase family 2 protein [Pseudomonadota bacterium]
MLKQSRVGIVIPTYNHGSRVRDVVYEAGTLGFPVFVVDDGSTDATAEVLSSLEGITVLTHPENRGKGAALRTGFKAARKSCDWVVTLDADGQHKAEDIPNLLRAVPDTLRPIVIGRRQGMSGQHVPWTSRFGRKFSNFWVWVSGGPLVEDSQSGFRLYPLPEALNLDVQARRFQFEVEILVKAREQGISVLEAPVQVVYQKGAERISHFHPWKDFWRNSSTFSRLIWKRIFSGRTRS